MALVEDPGARAGVTGALLRTAGAAESGIMTTAYFHRTAVYMTRTHGGVGGGSREAFPYPD